MPWSSKIFKIIALSGLFFFYGVLFVRPLDITSGDLGRHLTNGRVLVESFKAGAINTEVLHTNFYSYTHPDFPFLNHHWLTGVVFYLIFSGLGFAGLQLIFTAVSLITISLFMCLSIRLTNFWLGFASTFFLLRIITERSLVRPELISYLGLGIVLFTLWNYLLTHKTKYLWWLPLVFLAWVNAHIYFIFGYAVLGIFWLDALSRRAWKELKIVTVVGLTSLLAGLINPFGYKTLLYPFMILDNFGFMVSETRTLIAAIKTNFNPALVLQFKIALVLFWTTTIALLIKKPTKFNLKIWLLGLLFSALPWYMIRNFTMFGLFMVPLLAYQLQAFWQEFKVQKYFDLPNYVLGTIGVGSVVIMTLIIQYNSLSDFKKIGFRPDSSPLVAAEHIKNLPATGPIFNDFSSGSFLLFSTWPDRKVFVDQRPEAYPADFFTTVYTPALRQEAVWQGLVQKYQFGMLVLTAHKTPKAFINRRLADPAWHLEFQNDHYLIFTAQK